VVAREEVQEEKRLVAYYTVAETEDETAGGRVRGEELRAYLRQSLPGVNMVPTWYVRTGAVAFDGEREGGPQGVARSGGRRICGAWVMKLQRGRSKRS